MAGRVRHAIKSLLFGSANFPQQCWIGLSTPQSEISVWLHGLGPPRDVTENNVMAAARPLTIGIGLEDRPDVGHMAGLPLTLQFREHAGQKRLLGSISLQLKEVMQTDGDLVGLFETRGCTNYCLPRGRLWAKYAHYEYQHWRSRAKISSNAPMIRQELHCVFAFYICPRPVVLVSATDGNDTNIFPMDLVGPVGSRHFSLALHDGSTAAPLLERSRRFAVSTLPIEQTTVAYALGQNHNRASIALDEIPFETNRSSSFGIPVPCFAMRVREMQIEAIRKIGSHTMFLANSVADQLFAEGPEFFLIHGFYQAWRSQSGGKQRLEVP